MSTRPLSLDVAVSVDTAALMEAVTHHALTKQKTATAKATRNRNCPTWNQGDFSLSGLSASSQLSSERPLR
jgi:hypothetical protein